MLSKFKLNYNNKGFTLIELMIVIAIIGILAAIAVPNFIAYRNKTFCSAVESDANAIASEIGDYFAIPTHTAIVTADLSTTMSNGNTFTIAASDPNVAITISVTDGTGRCPDDYINASTAWTSGGNYEKVVQ